MSAMPVGVSVMPLDNRRETLIGVAMTAERLGFHAYFLPETWAHDITVLMAEASIRTRHLLLGTGILGVWGRSAGTLAMAAASLSEVSSGRFVLGLGASTPQLTEGLHDVPFVAPLARMRRTVTQVRALLGGERVPLAVATGARPLKLNLAASSAVPIFLAALTDESVRLAGELADGWLPFLYPRRCLAQGGSSCARAPRARATRAARVGLSDGPDGGVRRSGRSPGRRRVVRLVLPHDDGAALPPVARASGIQPRDRPR